MIARNKNMKPEKAADGVERKILARGGDLMMVQVFFELGAVGAVHSHPHQQVSYVLEGSFELETGSELELIRLLANWANGRFGHMQPLPYPSWDAHEILDKADRGDAFGGTFKAALFVQACNAVGLTARLLGINKNDEAAHTVAEAYNNELRQWMLVDPWFNGHFEKDGRPLSALDLHRAGGRPS